MNPYYRDMALALVMALIGMMLVAFCICIGYSIYGAFISGKWEVTTIVLQAGCVAASFVAFMALEQMLFNEQQWSE